MPRFERIYPLRDFNGQLCGTFAGDVFVASYRDLEVGRSALVSWSGPDAAPELITPVDGAILALECSPDGRRVAMAVVYPDDFELLSSRDPAGLVLLDLERLSGQALLTPRGGASFGADIVGPQLLWSADGQWLAMGAVVLPDRARVATFACRLPNDGGAEAHFVDGRPVAWREGDLLLVDGSKTVAWCAMDDAFAAWDGEVAWPAPDKRYHVSVTYRDTAGAANATRPGPPDQPFVPIAANATGTRAVFRQGDGYFWALAAGGAD